MSRDEQDAVVGRLFRELHDAENQLACYRTRAKQLVTDLQKAANELNLATEPSAATQSGIALPNYTAHGEAATVLKGLREQKHIAEERRKSLNELLPTSHGTKLL